MEPFFCKCGATLFEREGFAYFGKGKALEKYCPMCGRVWPIALQVGGEITAPYTPEEMRGLLDHIERVRLAASKNGKKTGAANLRAAHHKGLQKTYKRRAIADTAFDPDPDTI